MSAASEYVGALSPEAEAVLAKHDLYSEQAPWQRPDLAVVRASEGEKIAIVTRTISAFDLEAIIRHGRSEYDRGFAAGENNARAVMRRALGIEA